MKNIVLLFSMIVLGYMGVAQKSKLSKGERTFAINYLKETQSILLETVKDIDGELWNYKPSAESWPVAGCFEHILYAEGQLTKKVMEGMIAGEAAGGKNLAPEDGLVIAKVADRSQKVKTPESFEPSGRWPDKQAMINELNRSRAELISFVETTKVDLRSFKANSPVGERDAYQHLLIVAGHGLRHTMQMKEVIEAYKATASSK